MSDEQMSKFPALAETAERESLFSKEEGENYNMLQSEVFSSLKGKQLKKL